MQNNTHQKSWFGPFNFITDEIAHAVIAFIVALIGYIIGLSFFEAFFVFVAGAFLIDIDHLLNVHLCKKVLKISAYKPTLASGHLGHSIHALHGIDIALILSIITGSVMHPLVGWMMFFSLVTHLLWDFAVYPAHLSFLLLITRAQKGFNIGHRKEFVGRIFDDNTLTY